MEDLCKDELGIILRFLSNEDIIKLKSSSWTMYRKLFKYKPEIEYSTIVLWSISMSDPNKESAFEIKHIKSKDLRKVITEWGQEIIDIHNQCSEDWCDCKTFYSDFCYDCRLVHSEYDPSADMIVSKYYCDKHNNKHAYLTDESYESKLKCGDGECLCENYDNDNRYHFLIYPYEGEGYNCDMEFTILDPELDSSYYYRHVFYVYTGQKQYDTSYFCIHDH